MLEIAQRIDAGSSAVDEPRLARQAANAGIADLPRRACDTGRGSFAPRPGTAMLIVRCRIDAFAVAIQETGLTGQATKTAAADLTRRADDASIRCRAIAARAAVIRIGRRVDASSEAVHQARLA